MIEFSKSGDPSRSQPPIRETMEQKWDTFHEINERILERIHFLRQYHADTSEPFASLLKEHGEIIAEMSTAKSVPEAGKAIAGLIDLEKKIDPLYRGIKR